MGVIGYPLGHTLSPIFQQAALDHLKIKGEFKAIPLPPNKLENFIKSMKSRNLKAVCVTIPHKESVINLIDKCDKEAKLIGSVNWIINANDQLRGYNTDYIGFLRSLNHETSFSCKGQTATIFGAGGSSKAVSYGLKLDGLSKLIIINRTKSKALDLAGNLRSPNLDTLGLSLDDPQIPQLIKESKLIINSTSLGMSGGPSPNSDLINSYDIEPGTIGYDLVYSPQDTPFLKKIKEKNGIPVSGLSMLVFQGIEGFKLSTGIDPPEKLMLDITKSLSQ